ncbi:hypothetical protein HpBTM60_04530 [Helicobacter pylori]
MAIIPYQLLKDNEPIALGSMTHCLDMFYWEIYYGYNHLAYNIVPSKQDVEVYRKAKAFDKVVAETTGAIKNFPEECVDKVIGKNTITIINKYEEKHCEE